MAKSKLPTRLLAEVTYTELLDMKNNSKLIP
jgi:hypothetical protein